MHLVGRLKKRVKRSSIKYCGQGTAHTSIFTVLVQNHARSYPADSDFSYLVFSCSSSAQAVRAVSYQACSVPFLLVAGTTRGCSPLTDGWFAAQVSGLAHAFGAYSDIDDACAGNNSSDAQGNNGVGLAEKGRRIELERVLYHASIRFSLSLSP